LIHKINHYTQIQKYLLSTSCEPSVVLHWGYGNGKERKREREREERRAKHDGSLL
jgi:hypothetical protein